LNDLSAQRNDVYDAVRETLILLGLDASHLGTPLWNPLRPMVTPGDTVVVKPNFVASRHAAGGDLYSIITHPSILRAVVDYVYLALGGRGRIVIADAPEMSCHFTELLEETGLGAIQSLYQREREFAIEVYDLRSFEARDTEVSRGAFTRNRYKLPGDPLGQAVLQLGGRSLFAEIQDSTRYYGADYDRAETIRNHSGDNQTYTVSKTILSADVVISVPKLKVHKKVGVTLNMKGLVGICTNKNCLVHYRLGTPCEGGDQFPDGFLNAKELSTVRLQRRAYDLLLARKDHGADLAYRVAKALSRPVRRYIGLKLPQRKAALDAGSWYGNDSAWRMTVDLLTILLYADREGRLQESPQRRVFSIVDGIVGGEREGPLIPDAKKCGLIVAGSDLCAVDIVCARLMGFDHRKIKMLAHVDQHRDRFRTNGSDAKILANIDVVDLLDSSNRKKYYEFVPPAGWMGHIEKD
jgi:uncharacterized protein (DUF362 family)